MSLRICPAKAYLTNKLDVFSENDPFIVFELGTQKQRTKTLIDQKSPTWDEEFTFKPEKDNILKIQAMDEDEFLHEEIGTGSIDLGPYFHSNQYAEKFISLKTKQNMPAGKLLLKIMPMNYVPNPNVKVKKLRSNDQMVWYVPPSQRRGGNQPKNQIQQVPQQGGIYQPNQYGGNVNPINVPPGMQPSINSSGISNQVYNVPQGNMIYTNPPNQNYYQNYYQNNNQAMQQQFVHEQPMGQASYVYPGQRQSGGFKQKIYNKLEGLGQRMNRQMNQHTRSAGTHAMYRYD